MIVRYRQYSTYSYINSKCVSPGIDQNPCIKHAHFKIIICILSVWLRSKALPQIVVSKTLWILWTNKPRYILTHWGRVTHICVTKLTIIGSDNGLSPDRRQTIIWTNAGILLIGPLGTQFSEILIEIWIFSFKKMLLKMSPEKRRPSCLGLNVLPLRTPTITARHFQ